MRETPGLERMRAQVDAGTVDAVGPSEIANAFEMKESVASRRDWICTCKRERGQKLRGEEDRRSHGGWRRSEFEDPAC